MSRPGWQPAAVLAVAVSSAACAGAARNLGALDEMDRVRSSAGAREGAGLAPEMYARAEQERDVARQAHRSGDELASALHAQHAVAAYGHALAIGRLARATADLAEAQKALEDAMTQEQALEASRERLERDADELQSRLRTAREKWLPAPSGPSTPEREAARTVAARSLAMQARLLCSAARLVAADATGLDEATGETNLVDERLAKNTRPVPIDDAARVRTHCLDLLTRARRGAGDEADTNDGLLSELSAAGGWDPARDERGVTVSLRDAFHGRELTAAVAAKLTELGQVAVSHPRFAVQVVVHDAAPPATPNDPTDARRAEAAVHALITAGVDASRVHAELAGTRAPVVDPGDAKARGRNERLEVVFVSRGAQ